MKRKHQEKVAVTGGDTAMLALGSCVIPLLYSPNTIDPALSPRFLAWGILILCLLLFTLIKSGGSQGHFRPSVLRRAIFPIFAGYFFWSCVSLVRASSGTDGIFSLLKVLLAIIFLYAATVILSGGWTRRIFLARVVTVLSGIISLIGICQYFGLGFQWIPGNFVIYATMAHKNLLASFLFLTLPFMLCIMGEPSGLWRVVSPLACAAALAAILLTRCRAVWLALIIASIITMSVIWKIEGRPFSQRGNKNRGFAMKNILAVLLMVFMIFLSLSLFYERSFPGGERAMFFDISGVYRVPTYSIFSRESMKVRTGLWKNSLQIVGKNPLLGVGPGQWKVAFPLFEDPVFRKQSENSHIEVSYERPHNDYLNVLSEEGIPGFLCFLTVYALVFFYLFKIIRNSGDRRVRSFSYTMLFGMIGYLVCAFFSFPGERIAHTIFLMLIMANVVSAYHAMNPGEAPPRKKKIMFGHVFMAIAVSGCVFFGYGRVVSECHAKKAIEARREGNWQRVLVETDLAGGRFYDMCPGATPLSYYRGEANLRLGNIRNATQNFLKALRVHPNHFHTLNNLGTCYFALGRYNKAYICFLKALKLRPNSTVAARNGRTARRFMTGKRA